MMITIKSFEDIESQRRKIADSILNHLEFRLKEIIEQYQDTGYNYNPDKYGYYVILEKGDDVRNLNGIGLDYADNNLIKVIKEYADYYQTSTDSFYDVLVLYTNECGMLFIIPDEEWLDQELKDNLISL